MTNLNLNEIKNFIYSSLAQECSVDEIIDTIGFKNMTAKDQRRLKNMIQHDAHQEILRNRNIHKSTDIPLWLQDDNSDVINKLKDSRLYTSPEPDHTPTQMEYQRKLDMGEFDIEDLREYLLNHLRSPLSLSVDQIQDQTLKLDKICQDSKEKSNLKLYAAADWMEQQTGESADMYFRSLNQNIHDTSFKIHVSSALLLSRMTKSTTGRSIELTWDAFATASVDQGTADKFPVDMFIIKLQLEWHVEQLIDMKPHKGRISLYKKDEAVEGEGKYQHVPHVLKQSERFDPQQINKTIHKLYKILKHHGGFTFY